MRYIYHLNCIFNGKVQQEHEFLHDDKMRDHLSYLIRNHPHLTVNKVVYAKSGKTVKDYNLRLKQYYGV